MTEHDYMANDPACSIWKDTGGHCCPDGTHQADCVYRFTLKEGKRYLNGYGRIIGPMIYHPRWKQFLHSADVYDLNGKAIGNGSRLRDLVKEYVAPVITTQPQTPESVVNCNAMQHSDSMVCLTCDQAWDMNDPDPPKCASEELAPPPRTAFPWHDLISLTGTHLLMFGLGFGTAAYFLIGATQ